MSEYIVEMYDECEKYFSEYGCKPTNTQGFPLREEIVRCRDCVHSIHFFHHGDERWQCTEPYQEGDDVKPDAYCWRGERKEGGE